MSVSFNPERSADISMSVIFKSRDPYNVSNAVSRLQIIEKDGFTKPVYKLTASFNSEISKLLTQDTKVLISLEIRENLSNEVSSKEEDINLSTTTNITLIPITIPDIEFTDEKALIDITIECVEYYATSLDTKLESINLRETTVETAVKYLINRYKDVLNIKSTLINKITNSSKYNEIQIPSGSFFESLRYLDITYGLFIKSKASFYITKNKLYIVDKNKLHNYMISSEHSNNINILFASPESLKSISNLNDLVDNEEVLICPYGYMINDVSSTYRYINGTKKIAYKEAFNNPTNTIENIEISTDTSTKIIDEKIKKVVDNKVHNPFTIERNKTEQETNLLFLDCIILGSTTTNHKFNTQYNITFNRETDTKYSGIYVLIEQGTTFAPNNRNGFSIETQLKLRNIQTN